MHENEWYNLLATLVCHTNSLICVEKQASPINLMSSVLSVFKKIGILPMFVSDSARKCVEIMHMPWCVCLYICVRVRVDEAFVMCICQFLMCICLFECRFYSTICSFSQIHFTFLLPPHSIFSLFSGPISLHIYHLRLLRCLFSRSWLNHCIISSYFRLGKPFRSGIRLLTIHRFYMSWNHTEKRQSMKVIRISML